MIGLGFAYCLNQRDCCFSGWCVGLLSFETLLLFLPLACQTNHSSLWWRRRQEKRTASGLLSKKNGSLVGEELLLLFSENRGNCLKKVPTPLGETGFQSWIYGGGFGQRKSLENFKVISYFYILKCIKLPRGCHAE